MVKMPIEQQLWLFLYLCILGLIGGLIFDFFKAWRITYNISRRATVFLDLTICLFLALSFYYLLLCSNRGEVRFYSFIALLVGIILYFAFGSSFLLRKFMALFQTLKILEKKIAKTIRSWQELVNKNRTISK